MTGPYTGGQGQGAGALLGVDVNHVVQHIYISITRFPSGTCLGEWRKDEWKTYYNNIRYYCIIRISYCIVPVHKYDVFKYLRITVINVDLFRTAPAFLRIKHTRQYGGTVTIDSIDLRGFLMIPPNMLSY